MQKALLVLALVVVPAAGASLRRGGEWSLRGDDDPADPKDIKEKWGKMDEFLKVMFSMACKWKNGKDVFGEGAEALKKGKVDGAAGYEKYVTDLQAKNVKGLERACGMIVGEGKKNCRDGCAARWNALARKRDACDEKCVSLYASFESSCKSKADSLEKVYHQKAAKAEGQKQCYKGFCSEFPQVWMKSEAAEMEKEVETQCKDRCTEDNIKLGCQQKWAVEIDFVTAEVNTKCTEDSGVSKCMGEKTEKTKSDFDKCKKDKVEGECGKAFDECKSKGKTDKTFKDAEAFCTDRKKMCVKQTNEKCLKDNNAALDKAEADCKKEAGNALEKCTEDELKSREEKAEKKCIDEKKPTCDADCKGKCQVTKMNDCLKVLENEDDPGKLFCTDFYDMLHHSAEIDPITGDPAWK